jgi:hypothetical protein
MPARHWGVRATSRGLGSAPKKPHSRNRQDPGTAIQEFLIAGGRSRNVRSFHMSLEPEFGDQQTSPLRNSNPFRLHFGNRKSFSMHAPIKFQFAGYRDRDGVPMSVEDLPKRRSEGWQRQTEPMMRKAGVVAWPRSGRLRAEALVSLHRRLRYRPHEQRVTLELVRHPRRQTTRKGKFPVRVESLVVRETAIQAGNVLSTRCTIVHVDSTALQAPRRTDGDGLGPRAFASDGEGWVCDREYDVVTRPSDSHCSWLFSKKCFKCREIPARLNRSPLDEALSNLWAYARIETEATRVPARCGGDWQAFRAKPDPSAIGKMRIA